MWPPRGACFHNKDADVASWSTHLVTMTMINCYKLLLIPQKCLNDQLNKFECLQSALRQRPSIFVTPFLNSIIQLEFNSELHFCDAIM